MFKFINKATKKLSDYFKHDEEIDNFQSNNIEDSLIYMNSQIVIWKETKNFDDDSFNQIFSFRFNNKFMIFNLIDRKIEFKTNSDKILDFKVPSHPSYTFEFLVTFAISAKNWLSLDSYNILIVHDHFDNPKILCLLSTVLSYLNKNLVHPMDLYANIISTNKLFSEMENVDAYKNIIRYINYFSMIQNNPIFEYKKIFLKTILINGAPAIENMENKGNNSQHYLLINDKSYYKPVIRIIANEKVCYCSYKKNSPIDYVFYSAENCAKFEVNSFLFGDILLEILHYNEKDNKFRQLFVIQFHSFFVSGNSTRFTKDQIDGICKDIRYPNEFFVDLIFDEDKTTSISTYEEDVAKWKNIISDFIIKSFRSNNNNNSNFNTSNNSTISQDLADDKSENKIQNKTDVDDIKEHDDKDEDLSIKPNTLNKAQEILNKFSKENKDVRSDDDEDDDDDIENYLKDLENKSKL